MVTTPGREITENPEHDSGGRHGEAADQPWPRELDLIKAAAAGLELDASDGPVDLQAMKNWGPARTIRASELRKMLADQHPPVHAKGVRLRGLRISGCLDLEGMAVRCPLRLRECYLDDPGPVILDYASASLLTFTGCRLAGLAAEALTVSKKLSLSGSTFTGPVCLASADISGALSCDSAHLTVPDQDGNALAANGLRAAASVSLSGEFTAAGGVDLTGASIGASLIGQGNVRITQPNNDGNALILSAAKVGGHVLLDSGFTAAGAVQLGGADITGAVACSGAQLAARQGQDALAAEMVKVGGDLSLDSVRVSGGAVRLVGADIGGLLNLRDAELQAADEDGNALVAFGVKTGGDLRLDRGFTAEGAVWLTDAVIGGGLMCSGAQLNKADRTGNALVATRVKAVDVWLDRPFTAKGAVQLGGADITGALTCSGAQLDGAAGGHALMAELLKTGGDVSLDGACAAAGGVRLVGADIGGLLNLRDADLQAADDDGNSLVAFELKTGNDLLLDRRFTAAGAVSLTDAVIGGGLSCSGANLNGDAELDQAGSAGTALAATRVKAANIWLDTWPAGQDGDEDRPFTAKGTVELSGADISRNVACSGAQLTAAGQDGNSLAASGLKTGGDLLLDHGFSAAGTVWLTDAIIGGGLRCSGAQLNTASEAGNALVATRVKAANIWLDTCPAGQHGDEDRPFIAKGTVELSGADIGGTVACSGAQLTPVREGGSALTALGLKTGGDVLLDQGFTAGPVQLASAKVGGSLRLTEAALTAPDREIALDATGAQVTRDLAWAPRTQVRGTVSLEDAQAGQLEDDWTADRAGTGFWPGADQGLLRLDGFTYSRIGDIAATLENRLYWIGSLPGPSGGIRELASAVRHPQTTWREQQRRKQEQKARKAFPFTTQPYEQLATAYQQAGQDSEARAVAVARRRDLRKYGHITPWRKFGNWLLDKTILYGYQTWRAVVGIAVLYVIIISLFWYAQHRGGLMVAVGSVSDKHPAPTAEHCTSYYPCYYPAGYAVDTVIPLVNIHQASNWGPDASAPYGWIWTFASWAGTIFGWALATLAVAGYTGLVRSQDSL